MVLLSGGLDEIERQGAVPATLEARPSIAANALDDSGNPDCRPEFYASVSERLRLGSTLGTQYGVSIAVEMPLIALTKAEIARAAVGPRRGRQPGR